MNLQLEPYQVLGRDFLVSHERAYACVGLGLGKTAITLSALHELFVNGEIRAALVVAPLRVARVTWPNEIAKWEQFKWMKVEVLKGDPPSGNAHIYLINYDRVDRLEGLDFCDVVVFDETTKAKNPKSKRIKAVRGMLRHHRRWGLTGTPRPNSMMELFAQIRLLDDGARLGSAFTSFRERYFYPTDYMRFNWEVKPGMDEVLYKKISDITLTLRTSDYLDLPDTVVEDIEVYLPENVRDTYAELEKEFFSLVGSDEIVVRNAAVLVNKLLQVCGGNIYSEGGKAVALHDVKLQALKTLITTVDEPVIVASNFIHEREAICANLGLPDVVDAAKFRGNVEREWNSGYIRVLVADPRSLGHGLNLQAGGRRTVWYSPTWSRELYDQFNARVARKGQQEQPYIHRIICPGTIDEAVIETLHEKGRGQAAMLAIMSNYRKLKS